MVAEVLIEGVAVGVSTVLFGITIGYIIYRMISSKKNIDEITSKSHYVPIMISLFITGFAFHVLFEIFGLNSWFCKERFPKTRKN